MYIRRIEITNLRVISSLVWEIEDAAKLTGWHVIVGDNGSGKSTFLRAVAAALLGRKAYLLRQPWKHWVRNGEGGFAVVLELAPATNGERSEHVVNDLPRKAKIAKLRFNINEPNILGLGPVSLRDDKDLPFSAAYGPFRQFTGNDKEPPSGSPDLVKLARHLSLFGEDVALTECLAWLKELRFKQLEDDKSPQSALLESIKAFVNQDGFLPSHTRLAEVTSSAVTFVDGYGTSVDANDLSDGYRSVLSMTFELIRQLTIAYGPSNVFSADGKTIDAPGIVLIDEIDAHLHPTWQRRIGFWLREHFPNIQFIVTSHSPLVCQAAERGSIFRLPSPDGSSPGGMVTGDEFQRLVNGNVLEAYGTDIFGEDVTRSDRSRELLTRLAELNVKQTKKALSKAELAEQTELRRMLPTDAGALRAPNAQGS